MGSCYLKSVPSLAEWIQLPWHICWNLMGNSGSKKIYVWKLPSRACCLKNFVIQLPFAWVSLLANGNRLPCWEHLEGILRYFSGAGRTAIVIDARQPINWLSSLMEADDFHIRSPQSSLLSLGEGSVSFLLSWLPYPKIVYSDMFEYWFFAIYQKTQILKKIYQSVPHKCQLFLRRNHQQYIVQKNNQSYIQFSQQRKGTLINFVNILWAGPKPQQRQRNW